jgi:hypothetical protein
MPRETEVTTHYVSRHACNICMGRTNNYLAKYCQLIGRHQYVFAVCF